MSLVGHVKEQLPPTGLWSVDPAEQLALTARGQLDRSDYGLVRNRLLEAGDLRVGETVELVLDVADVRID